MRGSRAAERAALLVALGLAATVACSERPAPRDALEVRPVVSTNLLAERALAQCHARRGAETTPPRPFTTDACSAWPDGSWAECCVVHDLAYWCGGDEEARGRADDALDECVSRVTSGAFGTMMWLGVWMGGAPWLPTPWRWGYGWDYPAGYTTP